MVAILIAVTFRFPFYIGDWTKDATPATIDLNARTTIWLTIVSVITGALGFVNIFLFDNRKLQLKLAYLGIFLTIVLLTMYFLEVSNFAGGGIALWAVFYFGILACFILAARGIWKDQKLVKSMDRLR